MPVLRTPGSIPRVISGVIDCGAERLVSWTANRPCFLHLTALPASSHLRALDGLVGARGAPSLSRTGTVVWL